MKSLYLCKLCQWGPHLPNIEILILYVLSNDDCKFAIILFAISWGPFENINLFYFLLKMQIWNDWNVFNIPGNLIKDINVSLSLLNVDEKVWNGPPRIGKIF